MTAKRTFTDMTPDEHIAEAGKLVDGEGTVDARLMWQAAQTHLLAAVAKTQQERRKR